MKGTCNGRNKLFTVRCNCSYCIVWNKRIDGRFCANNLPPFLNIVVMVISIFVTPILVRSIFQSLLTEGADALQQVPLMLVLFIILRFGARVIVSSADLVAKLPVIRTMNRFLGFVAGVVQGLLIVWGVFLFAEIFHSTSWGMWINTMSETNEYVKYLYEHNILKDVVLKHVLK